MNTHTASHLRLALSGQRGKIPPAPATMVMAILHPYINVLAACLIITILLAMNLHSVNLPAIMSLAFGSSFYASLLIPPWNSTQNLDHDILSCCNNTISPAPKQIPSTTLLTVFQSLSSFNPILHPSSYSTMQISSSALAAATSPAKASLLPRRKADDITPTPVRTMKGSPPSTDPLNIVRIGDNHSETPCGVQGPPKTSKTTMSESAPTSTRKNLTDYFRFVLTYPGTQNPPFSHLFGQCVTTRPRSLLLRTRMSVLPP